MKNGLLVVLICGILKMRLVGTTSATLANHQTSTTYMKYSAGDRFKYIEPSDNTWDIWEVVNILEETRYKLVCVDVGTRDDEFEIGSMSEWTLDTSW